MKKLVSIVLALAMIMMVAAASAATITITPPDNTPATEDNTYTVYKIFDATPTGDTYTYSLMSGKTDVPANTQFVIDDAGNIYHGTLSDTKTDGSIAIVKNNATKYLTVVDSISQTEQDALKDYGTVVDTIETTGTTPGSLEVDPGYYYIASTTGSLVIVKTTDVTIKDKNEVPPLDKKITQASTIDDAGKNAIAQVGTNIQYTLTITKKKGAENYIVYDNLGTGLKYNKDAKVYIGETEQVNAEGATKYTKTTETDSALVVAFDNEWMAGLDDNTVVKVIYTALITEDALQTDPANNTAHLEYGHTPGDNSTPPVITHTYNAKFSVIKKDGAGEFLGGAGFVLKNTANKYYKYTAATASAPEKVEWVDSIEDATEYTSNATDGKLSGEFTGLADGTYTLVEKTVPTGYNKAADYTFTVKGANVEGGLEEENLIQSSEVINAQGTELPHTGGIGTTIFYILGGLLVVGAAVILIARRKAQD